MNLIWRRFRVGGMLFETNGPVVRPVRRMDRVEIEAIIRRHAGHAAEHPCFADMQIIAPESARSSWFLRMEYHKCADFSFFPLEELGNVVSNEAGMELFWARWFEYSTTCSAVWFWSPPKEKGS